MARWSKSKSEHSDCFSLGAYFAMWTISKEMFMRCGFLVSKANKFKKQVVCEKQVPYNKLLDTNLT